MDYFTQKIKAVAAMIAISGMISLQAQDNSLEIKVSDITCTDAIVTVTPSDNSFKYYWDCCLQSEFDEIGADNIISSHITRWENSASYYDDTTWQDMMMYAVVNGETCTSVSDKAGGLEWGGAEYVVYGFGMNAEGDVIAPLTTAEFKTLDPKVSENTFKVQVVSIVPDGTFYMTTTVKITPSNDDPYMVHALNKATVDAFDMTPGSKGEVECLKSQVLPYGQIYSGEQTVTFTKQRAERDFYIVTMGVEDGAPTTTPVLTEYKAVEMQKPVFKIEVTDISQTNAHIKIVPPSEDMLYYWYVTTPDVVANKGGGIENVYENLDRAWYEFVASIYGGEHTWQSIMRQFLYQGTIDKHTSEMDEGEQPVMRWDADQIIYAYGLDENCERITDIFYVEFKTAECAESGLTFDFEVYSVEPSKISNKYYTVAIDVMPSEEGVPFAFKYATTKVLDYYLENDDVDNYLYDQFLGYFQAADGYSRFILSDIEEGKEYYAMAIGWDEAPTTELYTFNFNSDSPAVTGVDNISVNPVEVVAVEGGIVINGVYDHAAVYGLDGRLVAPMRGDGASLSLPAGVYLVRYEVDGKTVSSKVMVR